MQIYADAVAVAVTVAARLELSFVEARSQCGKGKQCIILWCEKGAAIGDSALREDSTRMPAESAESAYRAYQDSSRGVTVWGQIEINNKNQTCNVTNAKAQRKTEAETNTQKGKDV